MRNVLAENLFAVSGVLSAQECEELMARGEGMGFEAATVSVASGPRMMTNVRNNDRVVFDDAELGRMLWDRVNGQLPSKIDGASAVGLNEKFRYYRYGPSQRFHAHRDGAVELGAGEKSRLTFMVYLNGGFEGGQTVFYSEERVGGLRKVVASVEPVAGMGLFFAHEWWHEGAAVVSGRKYVLRTDVMYKSDSVG